MEAINSTAAVSQPIGAGTANTLGELGSEDFLNLLIVQLTNQDPFEPVGNDELLRQISSVRDIELSTAQTSSLQALTVSLGALAGRRQFESVSALIGQHVTGQPDATGVAPSGVVVGIRFANGTEPTLQLDTGAELPVDEVVAVQTPLRAGEALVGLVVSGLDRRDPASVELVEGVVASAQLEERGGVLLQLDSGEALRLRDVLNAVSAAA